jgi:hypothetical protein
MVAKRKTKVERKVKRVGRKKVQNAQKADSRRIRECFERITTLDRMNS